ncbi:MAG: hypothetical protein IKM44_04585 [Clostridia bacterium]|nr:hypothetical protein [Clostridia bacterium]
MKKENENEILRSEEKNSSPLDITENETEPALDNDRIEQKKGVVLSFLKKWSGLIIVLGMVCLVVALGVIALLLGGNIYDKVSMIWILAFLSEFVVRKFVTKQSLVRPTVFVYGGLAVVFAVLYALSLAGILP